MLDRDLVLPHLIARHAERQPSALAVQDVAGRELTYADLYHTFLRWAGAYRRLGIETGQTVVTMLPNSFEAYFAWLGLSWIGALEVPANNMYKGEMLRYLITNSTAETLVIDGRFVERLSEVADDLDRLSTVVVLDAPEPIPDLPFRVVEEQDFLADAAPADDLDGPEYHDIMAIIYTSGTTGPSKGVLVPWAELFEFVRIMPDDTLPPGGGYYSIFPAFHVSGKSALYVSARFGGRLVIRESFSLTEFWNDIRAYECTTAGLVGPIAALLMLNPPDPADADNPIQNAFMGPLIPQVDEFMERFGIRVSTAFGMTEIGVPLAADGWNLANNTSCGRPRTGPPGYQVKVVDEHDEQVAAGEVGELVVRSDEPWVINAGYFGMPEKTAEAWRNGWFHTGDGFTYDEDDNFYFVDRLKDAIRRRGENVSSFEVEGLVNQHPAIAESAAIAIPSEIGEDDIKVCIVLAEGETLDPAELIEDFAERMPRFMVPRYIEFIDALPKTDATFRTRKVELRRAGLNENTWDREAAGAGAGERA